MKLVCLTVAVLLVLPDAMRADNHFKNCWPTDRQMQHCFSSPPLTQVPRPKRNQSVYTADQEQSMDFEDYSMARIQNSTVMFCQDKDKMAGALGCLADHMKENCNDIPDEMFSHHSRIKSSFDSLCAKRSEIKSSCMMKHKEVTKKCRSIVMGIPVHNDHSNTGGSNHNADGHHDHDHDHHHDHRHDHNHDNHNSEDHGDHAATDDSPQDHTHANQGQGDDHDHNDNTANDHDHDIGHDHNDNTPDDHDHTTPQNHNHPDHDHDHDHAAGHDHSDNSPDDHAHNADHDHNDNTPDDHDHTSSQDHTHPDHDHGNDHDHDSDQDHEDHDHDHHHASHSHTKGSDWNEKVCNQKYKMMMCVKEHLSACDKDTAMLMAKFSKDLSTASCATKMEAWEAASDASKSSRITLVSLLVPGFASTIFLYWLGFQ